MSNQPGDPGNTPDPDEHLTEEQTEEQDAIVRERLAELDAAGEQIIRERYGHR